MAEPKTRRTDADVDEFIDSVVPESKQADARVLLELFREVTGEPGSMWGDAIVGFGSFDYTYASGHSGTSLRIGFSPRKRDLTLYVMDGTDNHAALLERLGKHRTGKACLYVTRLANVDLDVLRELVADAWTAG
jgi:hypothetical protein